MDTASKITTFEEACLDDYVELVALDDLDIFPEVTEDTCVPITGNDTPIDHTVQGNKHPICSSPEVSEINNKDKYPFTEISSPFHIPKHLDDTIGNPSLYKHRINNCQTQHSILCPFCRMNLRSTTRQLQLSTEDLQSSSDTPWSLSPSLAENKFTMTKTFPRCIECNNCSCSILISPETYENTSNNSEITLPSPCKTPLSCGPFITVNSPISVPVTKTEPVSYSSQIYNSSDIQLYENTTSTKSPKFSPIDNLPIFNPIVPPPLNTNNICKPIALKGLPQFTTGPPPIVPAVPSLLDTVVFPVYPCIPSLLEIHTAPTKEFINRQNAR